MCGTAFSIRFVLDPAFYPYIDPLTYHFKEE